MCSTAPSSHAHLHHVHDLPCKVGFVITDFDHWCEEIMHSTFSMEFFAWGCKSIAWHTHLVCVGYSLCLPMPMRTMCMICHGKGGFVITDLWLASLTAIWKFHRCRAMGAVIHQISFSPENHHPPSDAGWKAFLFRVFWSSLFRF